MELILACFLLYAVRYARIIGISMLDLLVPLEEYDTPTFVSCRKVVSCVIELYC